VFDAVNDVSSSVLVREIEQMDGAGAVGDVHGDVADLAEAVSSFVKTEELGDGGGGLSAEFSRRYVGGEGGRCSSVFQEGAVEVNEQKLEEHAVLCQHRAGNIGIETTYCMTST
jgi:hypothetical protein